MRLPGLRRGCPRGSQTAGKPRSERSQWGVAPQRFGMTERPAGTKGHLSGLSALVVSTFGLLVLSAVAIADSATSPSGQVQTLEVQQSSTKASGKRRGRGVRVKVTFSLSKVDGSRASGVKRWDLRFPKSAASNYYAFPRCNRAKLKRKGPRACTRKSKVGTGTRVEDLRPTHAAPVSTKLTVFNARSKSGTPTLLAWGKPEFGPVVLDVLAFRGSITGPYQGALTYRFASPVFGVSPPALTTLTLTIGAKIRKTERVRVGRRGRRRTVKRRVTYNYLENPTSCTGAWPWRVDVEYENAEKLRPTDSVPCTK